MTGTMSTATSAWRTASAASVVARRRPAAWTSATPSARPGSSVTCERPALIPETTSGLTSTAVTSQPWRGELDRQRQAHLAGSDDNRPPDGSRLARPGRDESRLAVNAGIDRGGDGAAQEAGDARGAGDDSHSALSLEGRSDRSIGRRSAAAVSRALAIPTAQSPSSPGTYGRSPVRRTRTNSSSWARRGSMLTTGISATSPGEGGRVTGDHQRPLDIGAGEREPLGQIVELEHPLLADGHEAAPLGRGEPVHIEEPGGARREVHQPEEEVFVGGVDPLRRLGVDAYRPLAGNPGEHVDVVCAQVHGHADVADAGRERARAPARDGVDRGQPAGPQQPAHLEDRGVVPLHMTDLDSDSVLACSGDDGNGVVDRGRERLLDQDRQGPARLRQGR